MKTKDNEPPIANPSGARARDAVVIVLQNNADKSLIINSINSVGEELLGCAEGEFTGRRLEVMLGAQTATALADGVEYADDAPDLGDVFSRLREVRLRKRNGEEIIAKCKLTRLMAQGQSACFQLVVPNEQDVLATQKRREFIALNLEGRKELDPLTGLPDHKTAEEFLPTLENYIAQTQMSIVFAVIRLDRHPKSLARYGQAACTELLLHAYHCCRSTFRAEDMIFALSDHSLGVVLFDISRESTRVVLNRLRWKICGHRIAFGGKQDFSLSTCIGFDMLSADGSKEIFDRCEKTMTELDTNERNALIELGAA